MPIAAPKMSLDLGTVPSALGTTQAAFSLHVDELGRGHVRMHVVDPHGRGSGAMIFIGEAQLRDLEAVVAHVRETVERMGNAGQIRALTGPTL